MATATKTILCTTCGKENVAYRCEGCSQTFCINHLNEHHQSLIRQLDEIENKRDLFQQTLLEQKSNPQKDTLIEQINQWESNAISTIQQTADQARQLITKHTEEPLNQVDIELNQLTKQFKQIRQEEDFNEIHLNKFKQKLRELEEPLKHPATISIHQDNSSLFINRISVLISSTSIQSYLPNIDINTTWMSNGMTVAGGNGRGNKLNQLNCPWDLYIDDDQTIYVADCYNHRIVEWKKDAAMGQVVAGGKGAGNENDQLNYPTSVIVDKQNGSLIICDSGNRRMVRYSRRDGTSGETIVSNIDCRYVTMDNDGYFYVSDVAKHEVRRWKVGDDDEVLVAGGNGAGNRLDQLNQPYNIFVDQDQSVYVSESGNHRVMKWVKDASEGIIVAGGQGQGNALNQLFNARGIFVDQFDTLYVADQSNHRVMRWLKGAAEGSIVVGGNGPGGQANQLDNPLSLSIDRQKNLHVIDNNNHRMQKFNIDINSTP